MDFGSFSAGTTASEVVTLRNLGDEDLAILDLRVDDLDAGVDLGPLGQVLLGPGEDTDFVLSFSPQTAQGLETRLWVDSNDPERPSVEVPIEGVGVAPILDVEPLEYDFGTVYLGCDLSQILSLSNVGNEALSIEELAYDGSEFSLAEVEELPWTLEPEQRVVVVVEYSPEEVGEATGTLTIDSSDPASPLEAVQMGEGVLYDERTDTFQQVQATETDILLAVDTTGGMLAHLSDMRDHFADFVGALEGVDYHIAVVTRDDGCVAGDQPYIDSSMSLDEQETVFAAMLCADGSEVACGGGDDAERGFMLLESALDDSNLSGCNAGFYREDATLDLVGVADDPDQSDNDYSYYVSLFQSMKSDPDDVVIHAIGGDYPAGCGKVPPTAGSSRRRSPPAASS